MSSTVEHERARLVYKARLAEQAERWSDMAAAMGERIGSMPSVPLTTAEAMLFAVAMKNVVAPIRQEYHMATRLKAKYSTKGSESLSRAAAAGQQHLAEQVLAVCRSVEKLVGMATGDHEVGALLAKMAADYKRYDAEVTGSQSANEATAAAYADAERAAQGLSPSHAVRLGTALNHAVFTHDCLKRPVDACRIAESALNAGGGAAPADDRNAHVAATFLQTNLTLWRAEV